MTLIDDKARIRALLKQKRSALSPARRQEAKEALFARLHPLLAPYQTVSSFESFPEEIDTSLVNAHLGSRLLLPKVCGTGLELYAPGAVSPALLENVECIIVPGLGFDLSNRRIGYGKGHYDRLLSQCKTLLRPPLMIGIAFSEQLVDAIPCEEHDIAMDQLIIV